MNLYAELIEWSEKWVDYCFGTSLDNMTGLIHIDLDKGSYTIVNYPEGPMNIRNVESLAKRILNFCIAGDVRMKVSREIG